MYKRQLLHHVYGLGERLFRLVFLGRYGVNRRRALVVGDEHIERERREERTLAVLSTNKKECLSKAPVSALNILSKMLLLYTLCQPTAIGNAKTDTL